MQKLFGDKLLTKDGEKVDTTKVLGDVDVVGIYFSAHWCPPCRGFTPKLAEYFGKHAKSRNFQIVFASSDQDEAAFKSYYKEMPWLALPFSNRAQKEKLSKKYKVSGIPSLVLVDAKTGALITTDGRSGVMKDFDEAKDFPYKPKSWKDFVDADAAVVTKAGGDTTKFSVATTDKKYVAFYFSAHWCGPCRQFTPELAKWYEAHKSDEFELFFVSADKGESEFVDYHKSMPFPAMSFDSEAKNWLSSLFNVEGYPTLVVCDKETGKVVCGDARGRVSSEPEDFPWPEKAVEPLESSLGAINDAPLAILLVDKAERDKPEKVVTAYSAFTEVAEETFQAAAGASGASGPKDGAAGAGSCAEGGGEDDDEDERVRFAVGKAGDVSVSRIRDFFGLSADAAGSVRLFVSSIPTGKKFVWTGKDGEAVPTADEIRSFIADVKSGQGAMDLRKAPAAA